MPPKNVISILREHSIQPTPQRIAVAESTLWTKAHPTADTVWTSVKRKHPTISRATVYNVLNLLVNKGLLRTHILTDGATVFDPNMEHHHHFICVVCGLVRDFESAKFDKMDIRQEVQEIGSMLVTQIQVRGVCNSCRDKSNISSSNNK
jgi:Fur family transcriptional regulator, peroxide stress response regulator